jgi:hypothetical protein
MTIRQIFQKELSQKTRRGAEWAWSKTDLAVICKISTREVEQKIAELTQEPEFLQLMKTPKGYFFPKNDREFLRYLRSREKMAEGLKKENQRINIQS